MDQQNINAGVATPVHQDAGAHVSHAVRPGCRNDGIDLAQVGWNKKALGNLTAEMIRLGSYQPFQSKHLFRGNQFVGAPASNHLGLFNPAADEGGQSSYKLVVGRQIMSELKLRDDILDELEYEPIVDAAHIGVAVDRDVVTLTGHVGSYAQKLAAISAVRRVKGVHGIADEIEVRYASDAKASDDEITSRALNVLSWDSVVPGNAIQVTARDGLVTLTGKVNWYYQKSSAERDVRGLSGVRSVVNNIEIEPHAKPDNVKKKIEAALQRQAGIEAKDIRVTVRDDDEVLPEGKVRNWDEKFAVENAAWSVAGVKNVKDKLTIGS
jgi:osmotically-inducible protein OsmY